MGKIQEKINSCAKPKLNKLLWKHLIGPLLKVMLASEDKVIPLIEAIKYPTKDTLKSDYTVTPTKSVKSRKDFEQELNIHIDELNERIKQLEIENKALKYDLNENSRMYDVHQNSISQEKQKFEDLKKEIDSKVSEELKVKEDVNSKITNYKTRIFFLESQIEELENKKLSQIDMATNKLKNKNKQLEKDNKKLQKAKEVAEGKLEGLRSKLEEIIESEQQLKKQDKDNKGTIKKLQSLIEDLEKKLVELKTEYADKMYELELR
jgi:chromosome segregation ATPase